MRDWRKIVGRVAVMFATPLPAVLAMPWDEIVAWWSEAGDIHAETWGLLPSVFANRL